VYAIPATSMIIISKILFMIDIVICIGLFFG
jgi:hypothetical protein